MRNDSTGTTLRTLLLSVGEPLLEMAAGSPDVPIRSVWILDPDDDLPSCSGGLVLVIGVRGRQAVRYVRAAAMAGACAVAVKATQTSDDLRAAAEDCEIALLTVHPQARWEQVQTVVREVLEAAQVAEPADTDRGDLFGLAQTVAVLTGGDVSIEDAGNRVLAYSRSDEDVDELRRLSILGWEGPEQYLALLRKWGIFERLRTREDVVEVDERPEFGIRRRLAIGIRAGKHHLGTIWVQEGNRPFAEHADEVLQGAARMAASWLVRRRGSASIRSREELVAGLLEGRINADLVAGQLGIDPASSVIVLGVAPRGDDHDRPSHEAYQLQVSSVVSVHATSYHQGALVCAIGPRVYAVFPQVHLQHRDPAFAVLARHMLAALGRAGVRAQAGLGSPAAGLGEVVAARAEADRVLDALARTPGREFATMDDLRSHVMLDEVLRLLEINPALREPAIDALAAHDVANGSEFVPSLLAYLDALGDVRAAAGALNIHPNTLRHRIRRATAVSGLDLGDPRERLVYHLHLVLATRRS